MKTVVLQLELVGEPALGVHLLSGPKKVESEHLISHSVYEVHGIDENGNKITQLVNKLDNQPTCIFKNNFTNATCVVTRYNTCVSDLKLLENALTHLDTAINTACDDGNELAINLKEAFEDIMYNVICGEVM